MMIHHFFKGNYIHLSPYIMKSFLEHFSDIQLKNCSGCFMHCEFIDRPSFVEKTEKYPYKDMVTKYKNVKYNEFYDRKSLLLYLLKIPKSDIIVLHSLLDSRVVKLYNIIILFFHLKKKVGRVIQVYWGGEWKHLEKRKKRNLRNKFVAFVGRKVLPWYGKILAISEGDKKELKELFKSNNIKFLPYFGNECQYPYIEKEISPIRIMVSHSGWIHNNHIETFELLKRFRDEDIQIICPLCYGEQKYIKKIIDQGKIIFGKKFVYFTKLKSRDEYIEFINKNHIYITGANNQTGLGAIFYSIKGNVKIYVRGNLKYSLEKLGYFVNDYDRIKKISYTELVTPVSLEEKQHNMDIYIEKNITNPISEWKCLFENMLNN